MDTRQDPHQYIEVGRHVWWDIAYYQRPSKTRTGWIDHPSRHSRILLGAGFPQRAVGGPDLPDRMRRALHNLGQPEELNGYQHEFELGLPQDAFTANS